MKGSEFAKATAKLAVYGTDWTGLVIEQVKLGNIVDWGWTDIELSTGLVVTVANDYLAIGTVLDHFRVPLNGMGAQTAVNALSCILPSTMVVDSAHDIAVERLTPIVNVQVATKMGISGDTNIQKAMTGSPFAYRHSLMIDDKTKQSTTVPMRDGLKKDVVLSNRLGLKVQGASALAIYGWFSPSSGKAIQTCQTADKACTPHPIGYADYSHGVRLVRLKAVHGTQDVDMVSAYHAGSASYGGPLQYTAYGQGPAGPSGSGSGNAGVTGATGGASGPTNPGSRTEGPKGPSIWPIVAVGGASIAAFYLLSSRGKSEST